MTPTAVVTGAARGIGLCIAARLLSDGFAVSLWDRDPDALAAAAASLNAADRVHTASVDVTDFAGLQRAAADAVSRLGTITALVNNAGIAGANRPSWELSVEEWRQVIDIDLTGVFLCCKAVVPGMVAAKYGRIVNIASIAGKEGNANAAHYSAAKAGVIGYTKSLGKELAKTGVLCNAVTPAAIETEIFAQMAQTHIDFMLSRIPMGRFGQKEEAAALVSWLCSRECSFSTAAVFDLSGGRATY